MEKKVILISILTIIIIAVSIVLINKVLLNSNEKEILMVLKDLDYSLQHPEKTEKNEFNFKPSDAVALKEYVNSINEARKVVGENGNLINLFKVSFIKEGEEKQESILAVINGKLTGLTIDEKIVNSIKEENQQQNDWTNSITYKFIESINKIITDRWNQATPINNVNFVKILNKI